MREERKKRFSRFFVKKIFTQTQACPVRLLKSVCQEEIRVRSEKMIRELYQNIAKESIRAEKISPEIKAELEEPLDNMKKQLDEESYKQCKDGILLAVLAAKEDGFVEGFKYAFRLFSECVKE